MAVTLELSTQPGALMLVFADDWGEHPSSSQHLFRCLSTRHEVHWFNTIGRWPRLSRRDFAKIVRKVTGHADRQCAGGNPTVRDVTVLPLSAGTLARRFNGWMLRRSARPVQAEQGREGYLVSTLPLTADLFREVADLVRVYYVVDDYASWPGLGALTAEMDRLQAERADLIVCSSRTMAERYQDWTATTVRHLPHGVDVDHFSQARELRSRRGPEEGDVVFFGALDERFDQQLFAKIVGQRDDLRFVVLGPRTVPLIPALAASSVRFCPPVPFENLPHFLAGCRVALLPYVTNALGMGLSPLKIREALAAGLPVVTTPVPELPDKNLGIHKGRTVEELLHGIESALHHPAVPELKEFVGESWRDRAAQLEAWLREAWARKYPR